ncbi:biopolymer transport protein ExbD [Pacificibacter maritimus]|uniref:Biopolymer transport protein ExbD n=1 Tax=Pacificibacter maritimus TaxID=762213 RepID=A0A3N4ULN3_9RHOB|nr:biopolymer transporter ExbD [Pacificibacter maritimus]RPE71343.1 biopolymer transport protein ExbD [Pacificibacter maritimus]
MDLGFTERPRRRPSLTPMIDVVFLLLVFFMLASRFGTDMVIPLPLAGGGGTYTGAPRLIDVTPNELRLNKTPMSLAQIIQELAKLTENPSDAIVLRGLEDANLQHVISVHEALAAADYTNIVLIE